MGREASFAKRIPNNFVTRQALADKVNLFLKEICIFNRLPLEVGHLQQNLNKHLIWFTQAKCSK